MLSLHMRLNMFSARYDLNFDTLFTRNVVFKALRLLEFRRYCDTSQRKNCKLSETFETVRTGHPAKQMLCCRAVGKGHLELN
jgi:hypothetical protein